LLEARGMVMTRHDGEGFVPASAVAVYLMWIVMVMARRTAMTSARQIRIKSSRGSVVALIFYVANVHSGRVGEMG